jgi:hypothetical protein
MDTEKSLHIKASQQQKTIRFSAKANGPTLDEQLEKAGISTRQFGRWTILSERPLSEGSQLKVLCRCQCGVEKTVVLTWLISGRSKGCKSCASKATAQKSGKFVVETRQDARLQKRVNAMLQRCTNPSDQSYKNYGGRGVQFKFASIKQAVEWIKVQLPHDTYLGVDIDRIDNNGHYEPGNLRLVSRSRNLRNKRTTSKVYWAGKLIPLLDWTENPYSITAAGRMVAKGMTGEEIVAQAWRAVAEKRKGWRTIRQKLLSMTSSTADRATDL